ncbi:hypothetical protein M0638_23405 [Roseomonas sp. NAR14]|uniref:Uncharacterized protein n=1 Tax=Roseomonas acroporae TaxID=2937791 RepID=A0A9X1YBY3_9PROT|nr:hypothetical protein [Roseomonas acroporae]MCK8787323.1 hypothetical protein [Roseomonas acroporae]
MSTIKTLTAKDITLEAGAEITIRLADCDARDLMDVSDMLTQASGDNFDAFPNEQLLRAAIAIAARHARAQLKDMSNLWGRLSGEDDNEPAEDGAFA